LLGAAQHGQTPAKPRLALPCCNTRLNVCKTKSPKTCVNTPQYKSLEELHARYKDKGLVVLGFPSNDFSQEPDNNKKIADFCENTYGVKFPMFSKTTVRGSEASPLFKQLTKLTDTAPKWNFYKYLISRDGQKVQSFNSTTDPLSKGFLSEVDKLVAAQTP
jgi:glutathione peroxidase